MSQLKQRGGQNEIRANGEVILQNANRDHSKKRSNNSTQSSQQKSQVAKKIANSLIEGEPDLKRNSILWVNPGAGYDNPYKLTDIPVNSGKLFTRWMYWAKDDKVGYILFDKAECKYWSDPAATHILSRAEGYEITHFLFNFIVRRDKKLFRYGFTPKDYMVQDPATNKILQDFAETNGMGKGLKAIAAPPPEASKDDIDEVEDVDDDNEDPEVINDEDTAEAYGIKSQFNNENN